MVYQNERDVERLLLQVSIRWRTVTDQITKAANHLREVLGEKTYLKLAPQLEDEIKAMSASVSRFEASAKNPEVVIATTGTTSSGKSTLANLLVGEILLPKSVQEMSAGVVAVHHDPKLRKLVIEKTHGATWPTGSWEKISAAEVEEKLETTMKFYRELIERGVKETNKRIDPPQFDIFWPTRMGSHPVEFGLPKGAKLTILDLPGLKHQNDEVNGGVIRKQARKALCIVTYNSFETDPYKQKGLLLEVVDQVKALSGSPARMLFVLNRIDAFRTDRDPAASARSFTEKVTLQIREGISEALSEYTTEASKIEPIALSSEPALYAVLAEYAGTSKDHSLLRRIRKEYGVLFPDREMESLPGRPEEWTESQRRWFLDETRHQAHMDHFVKRLGAHIATNLPEILLPDLVDSAYHSARKVLESLDALVGAYSVQERKQAELAKNKLEELHQHLRTLQKEALHHLNPFREVASGGGDSDLVGGLYGAVPEVERALGIHGKLSPVAQAVDDAVQLPLRRLNDYVFQFMKGEEIEDVSIQASAAFGKFHSALESLRSSPYGRAWGKGGSFKEAEAESVDHALKNFAKELSTMATQVVTRESGVQAERIKVALGVCGEAIVDRIEREAVTKFMKADFSGLRGVFRGSFELKPPHLPVIRFSMDVQHWKISVPESRTVEVTVKKRVWWKLWLGRSEVKETRTVTYWVEKKGIEVSKLGDLLEGFIGSGVVTDLLDFYKHWLIDCLYEFDTTLDKRLKNGVKTYRLALEQRMEEIERGVNLKVERIDQFRHELKETALVVDSNRNWRDLADE